MHNMKLNPPPFEMIKRGQKTIELRLLDEKRQQIKAGDTIIFTNNATGETLATTVVKLHRFENFNELYKSRHFCNVDIQLQILTRQIHPIWNSIILWKNRRNMA